MPNMQMADCLHCARCNLIKVTFYASWRGKIYYLLHLNRFWRVKTQPLNSLCHSLFVGFGCMWYGVWRYECINYHRKPEVSNLKFDITVSHSIGCLHPHRTSSHMCFCLYTHMCSCSYAEPLMPLYNIRCWCFWAFLLDSIFSLRIFLEI